MLMNVINQTQAGRSSAPCLADERATAAPPSFSQMPLNRGRTPGAQGRAGRIVDVVIRSIVGAERRVFSREQ